MKRCTIKDTNVLSLHTYLINPTHSCMYSTIKYRIHLKRWKQNRKQSPHLLHSSTTGKYQRARCAIQVAAGKVVQGTRGARHKSYMQSLRHAMVFGLFSCETLVWSIASIPETSLLLEALNALL